MRHRLVAAGIALVLAILIVMVWSRREPALPTDIAQPPDSAALFATVDELLMESAASWNGDDLDGFMSWYRQGGRTTYIGSTGLVEGREAITERYAPLFEPGASRDSLRFERLRVRPLGPGLGMAVANYVLHRGDSITATGIFTLIVRETTEGWRIVHDHSSATSS